MARSRRASGRIACNAVTAAAIARDANAVTAWNRSYRVKPCLNASTSSNAVAAHAASSAKSLVATARHAGRARARSASATNSTFSAGGAGSAIASGYPVTISIVWRTNAGRACGVLAQREPAEDDRRREGRRSRRRDLRPALHDENHAAAREGDGARHAVGELREARDAEERAQGAERSGGRPRRVHVPDDQHRERERHGVGRVEPRDQHRAEESGPLDPRARAGGSREGDGRMRQRHGEREPVEQRDREQPRPVDARMGESERP
jgi:hypothetical protein